MSVKTQKGKKTTGAKARKALAELQQVDGEIAPETEHLTLESIIGDAAANPAGAATVGEYQEILAEMNKFDLQFHATKQGLVPIENRALLEERLVARFNINASRGRGVSKTVRNDAKISKEALDILAEG